ncbi:hypothetical protein COCCADRAFT_42247 [Bipolaris zeicola 26-R-13]|uniref:Cytochrome P450 n=1 Tax=Cochliobolus carbonum (strain 26-R-13) TaxID=930089 RepID=W6XMN6_COCC2|nr:uncharacterized protein COCCADRAFT_42247 [Bipolaris zeicola 26-R-13]EUC26773.1 hypothetical protein COCCADRAFT_42247 [Bipolaris zeicola 26-R-13]
MGVAYDAIQSYDIRNLITFAAILSFVLHPLAKYPGPFLGRCTNLYAAYKAWRGTLHIDIYECHLKYEIHSHGANNLKSVVYQVLVHGAPNTLTIRRKEEHTWRRRILSLALSDAKVTSYQDILSKHIATLCKNLERSSRSCDYFFFDVMSEVIFGMKYNAQNEPTYQHVTRSLADSNVRISALVQAAVLKFGRLDKILFRSSIKGRNRFLAFISSLLRDRTKGALTASGNVFSFLEKAEDPDTRKALNGSQIRAECATMVVAGSDTSSSTLAATLFYLSVNQQPYERVCQEIRDKFAHSRDICLGPQLSSCTYLRACIDEALRMSPPVGGALWREIMPGGMVIDSIPLPAGIDVGTGIYSLHHNHRYHLDPFKYMPERWLVGEAGSTEESVQTSRSAFVPFSMGPRSCVGKGFAYHELMLSLAHIIHRFDFYNLRRAQSNNSSSTDSEGRDEFLLQDHVTGAKKELYLSFNPRY